MEFKLAYEYMLKGEKIKRPCFKGYWYIDGVNGKLTIHLANGTDICEGELGLTVVNCLANDWVVFREEPHCPSKARKATEDDEIIKILDDFFEKYIEKDIEK